MTSSSPHYRPTNEDGLRELLAAGLLAESHHLELKAQIPTGRSSNQELARDLASLAVDGGTLMVGVAENDDGSPSLAPLVIDGLPERIEQVARFAIDPPLQVSSIVVPTQEAGLGYVVVQVPPSPLAPHMVAYRYMGRGDRTKQYLSDAEVLRLHERRQRRAVDMAAKVRDQFDRDPFFERRRQAHLFLVAEPAVEQEERWLQVVGQDGWQTSLFDVVHRFALDPLANALHMAGLGFSPDWDDLQTFALRPDGVALTSYALERDRRPSPEFYEQETVAELEVSFDGPVRVYMSRLSDDVGGEDQYIFESSALLYLHRLLGLILGLAERGPYLGSWRVGVGANGLGGASTYQERIHHYSAPAYIEDEYIRTTEVTYEELRSAPGLVAQRLLDRFLRALGTRQQWALALEPGFGRIGRT